MWPGARKVDAICREAGIAAVVGWWRVEVDDVVAVGHRGGMFEGDPKARADLKAGTLYAVSGDDGWVYYGQVSPDKSVGFFRRRDRQIAEIAEILAQPTMSVVKVAYPSITRALRSGLWKKLGRFDLAHDLEGPRQTIQWPVGTLVVTVWTDGKPSRDTTVDDPTIQDLERMAVWDAQHHIPGRLTADFGVERSEWNVGGPIWRERRIKEELASRNPDKSWQALPAGWVHTIRR